MPRTKYIVIGYRNGGYTHSRNYQEDTWAEKHMEKTTRADHITVKYSIDNGELVPIKICRDQDVSDENGEVIDNLIDNYSNLEVEVI